MLVQCVGSTRDGIADLVTREQLVEGSDAVQAAFSNAVERDILDGHFGQTEQGGMPWNLCFFASASPRASAAPTSSKLIVTLSPIEKVGRPVNSSVRRNMPPEYRPSKVVRLQAPCPYSHQRVKLSQHVPDPRHAHSLRVVSLT